MGSLAFSAPPSVSEQTQAVGLGFSHMTDSVLPNQEFTAAGGAAGDFDGDGDQDLFMIGGSGGVDRLMINDGTGRFVDQGAAWGVARTHRGTGAAVGDYDHDGDLDLYVTSLGPVGSDQPGRNVLYRNNGNHTFTDVTAAAGVAYTSTFNGDSYSASFGDYDLDGDLDLAVAGWLGGSRLYRNNGNGTFTNVTASALNTPLTAMRGYTPRFVDMDEDRYPELLWASDFGTSKYYQNDADGSFTERTASSGTGLDSNGMGNTFGDYDGDGGFDWYVSSRINEQQSAGSGNMLYLSTQSDHVFVESSLDRGCNYGYWGWGVVSLDINQDGALDIFETNGFDGQFMDDPSMLFLNDGSGFFSNEAPACGMDIVSSGRGALSADFDGDGDQDIVVFNCRQEPIYFRNDIGGEGTNAISITLDTASIPALAPNGFGTRVVLTSASHTQLRYMDGGSNYLSQSELAVHAGLGSDEWVDIDILWANGDTSVYHHVAPGRYTIRALPCPVDFTGDGALNFFDVSRFLTLYLAHHPQADLSGDGAFNFFDVSAFLVGFSSGCP